MNILLVCILLAFAVNSASASCSRGPAKREKHTWSNKQMIYCEYKGIKFLNGSTFKDADDCVECSCTDTGYTCCGFGFSAGPVFVEGCVAIQDHCDVALLNPFGCGLCKP